MEERERLSVALEKWIHGSADKSEREDGSWPREDEQPVRRLEEEVVGKGTGAGKGALTLPSVRPGVGLPPDLIFLRASASFATIDIARLSYVCPYVRLPYVLSP